MLAVHWSPAKNTKRILRNGITPSRRGLFCFPLTGHHAVDRWWAQAFRSWRPRTTYNGFVFRIVNDDLPAQFSDWFLEYMGIAEQFTTIAELERRYRDTLVFTIGVKHAKGIWGDFLAIGQEILRETPALFERYRSNPGWVKSAFTDHQIVLSRGIALGRIIRVVSGSQQSGRQRVRQQRLKDSS